MQINVKMPERAVEVQNTDRLITLKIDKKGMFQLLRYIGVAAMIVVLSFLLIHTFRTGSEFFWPLLTASSILVMVAFVAIQSNNQTKKR